MAGSVAATTGGRAATGEFENPAPLSPRSSTVRCIHKRFGNHWFNQVQYREAVVQGKVLAMQTIIKTFTRRATLTRLGLVPLTLAAALRTSNLSSTVAEAADPVGKTTSAGNDAIWVTKRQHHLDQATEAIERAVNQSLEPLAHLFARAHAGVPEFVDCVLGWTVKFKLAWDLLPGTANIRQQQYLRREFERCVLSESELQQTISGCLRDFMKSVESVESRLLVAINADLEDFPGAVPVGRIDRAAYVAACHRLSSDVHFSASSDLVREIAQFAAAELIEVLLKRLCRRLTTKAGMYGAGAAGAAWTGGASLMAAILIDSMLEWVWAWVADPHGSLERKLKHHLDDMHNALVGSSAQEDGLRGELLGIANARAAVRQAAIETFMQE